MYITYLCTCISLTVKKNQFNYSPISTSSYFFMELYPYTNSCINMTFVCSIQYPIPARQRKVQIYCVYLQIWHNLSLIKLESGLTEEWHLVIQEISPNSHPSKKSIDPVNSAGIPETGHTNLISVFIENLDRVPDTHQTRLVNLIDP